jgi:hypothetical protein
VAYCVFMKFGKKHLITATSTVGTALLMIVGSLPAQELSSRPSCKAATISFSLIAGETLQESIGDLTFKMEPLKSTGWDFSLEDAKGRDFIYPANEALRFNSSQTIGAGYGDSAKQSLSHGRDLRFLLNDHAYDAFEPYVEHALWPYTAPDPDHALDQYAAEFDKLRTGLLRLTTVNSDISENDAVHSGEFRLEFIAPVTFQFDASLPTQSVACPEATLPINERLPARVPVADPRKYQNTIAASEWKNPYVMITKDGFDLRFQSGRLNGPISILGRSLVGLPNSGWPYGRVVAAAENGVQSSGDTELIGKNKVEADKALRNLGVKVEWGPSTSKPKY